MVQKLRQIITKTPTNKKQKKPTTKNDPQIPQPDLRFATKQNSEATKNGAGPNKTKKRIQICLRYSDLSHRIILKNMQTNYPLRQCVKYNT